jgi:hypothetical protein
MLPRMRFRQSVPNHVEGQRERIVATPLTWLVREGWKRARRIPEWLRISFRQAHVAVPPFAPRHFVGIAFGDPFTCSRRAANPL